MAGIPVTGDIYMRIDGRLHEIKSQIRNKNGYRFDPEVLEKALQRIVEGVLQPRYLRTGCFDTPGSWNIDPVESFILAEWVTDSCKSSSEEKVVVADYDVAFQKRFFHARDENCSIPGAHIREMTTQESVTRDTLCGDFEPQRSCLHIMHLLRVMRNLAVGPPMACLCRDGDGVVHLVLATKPHVHARWRLETVPYIDPGVRFLERVAART